MARAAPAWGPSSSAALQHEAPDLNSTMEEAQSAAVVAWATAVAF